MTIDINERKISSFIYAYKDYYKKMRKKKEEGDTSEFSFFCGSIETMDFVAVLIKTILGIEINLEGENEK